MLLPSVYTTALQATQLAHIRYPVQGPCSSASQFLYSASILSFFLELLLSFFFSVSFAPYSCLSKYTEKVTLSEVREKGVSSDLGTRCSVLWDMVGYQQGHLSGCWVLGLGKPPSWALSEPNQGRTQQGRGGSSLLWGKVILHFPGGGCQQTMWTVRIAVVSLQRISVSVFHGYLQRKPAGGPWPPEHSPHLLSPEQTPWKLTSVPRLPQIYSCLLSLTLWLLLLRSVPLPAPSLMGFLRVSSSAHLPLWILLPALRWWPWAFVFSPKLTDVRLMFLIASWTPFSALWNQKVCQLYPNHLPINIFFPFMILILVNDRHPSPQTESMKLFTPFFPHIFSQPKRSVDSILLFLSPCSSFLLPRFKPPPPPF